MEATRRERILLYGAVPIIAACLGAVVTVIAQRMFGSTSPDEVMLAIIQLDGVTADERMKMMEAASASSTKFYSFINTVAIMLLIPLAGVIWSIEEGVGGEVHI